MTFPYGEWILLFLTLLTWLEKKDSRKFFQILTVAWFVGKGLEMAFVYTMPWHWNFSRIAVMVVFWLWAIKRSEKRFWPLLITCLVLCAETLFKVNEPGIFPCVSWLFAGISVLVAWLTANSFWGAAAALTGSALINLVFIRFTYDGIIGYMDFPTDFIWNFGVGLFSVWSGLILGRQYYAEKKLPWHTKRSLL